MFIEISQIENGWIIEARSWRHSIKFFHRSAEEAVRTLIQSAKQADPQRADYDPFYLCRGNRA